MKWTNNKWKVAFFSLLSIVTLITIFIMVMLYRFLAPIDDPEWEQVERGDWENQYPSFVLEANKDNLNHLIQQELDKEDPNREYDIYLEDEVLFRASFSVFGTEVPVEMNLAPEVTEDGNIILEETAFRIGNLSLPSAQIFRMIENMADLPDFVYINPNESRIYIQLQEGVSEDVLVEAEEFNLEEDRIRFTIFLTSSDMSLPNEVE
ncbi:YpmS family protein [Alteribacter aurantiacus]|uniref:YpmS family protein n=1 Tax=Alteribacter aurantiacus TaxID=254410 RepID=UPI0003FEA800|nr:YpmS family protein [Alteribacter aurantiacus]